MMKEERKIYYKVLDAEMCDPSTKFKYELNRAYTINDGCFHACKNMHELVLWTNEKQLKNCRFFRCYLGNIVEDAPHKVASHSITLMEEIPFEVMDEEIRNNIWEFVEDEDWSVRETVAKQGYGLCWFMYDEDNWVRMAVASQGYYLDELMEDTDALVRAAVARQGYDLDELIYDDDPFVRAAVAEQGYGLETLVGDDNPYVRDAAIRKLKERE